uniref:Squalene cyclase C-terminal domain-containing protein n=1 Tax=Tetradesmus obliquus TaxID=3088 RepID=A0A383VVZ0_TETOB|eukprot:jgi/Sobl393_1/3413/SZX68934.1
MMQVMKHIHYEDENTRYVDIGPVNKVINMLCCWFEDPDSLAFKKHLPRLHDYLWVAEDGMKMQGYNGSQLWDTSFAVQAMLDSGLTDVAGGPLKKAHSYIEQSQVVTEAAPPLSRYYRHISRGAWPFSSRDHGWPISDCTGEGFKAALGLAALQQPGLVGEGISRERLEAAVRVILSYQNSDGGMATYENTRSFHWLEILNPAETFGDIIVDYSYVECTSACITALSAFDRLYPGSSWSKPIAAALAKAEAFVRRIQRPDGSWYGSWGVCFTYGTWFGATALACRGHTAASDPALRKACSFLVNKQRLDGGWGESYLSCQDKVYSQLEGESHVVNTAWAIMALLAAGYHTIDPKPLHKGAAFLMRAQQASGDWPQQHISGVFNRNCMITYANYRNIFPIWALGLYRRLVLLGHTRDSSSSSSSSSGQGDRAWLCAVSDFWQNSKTSSKPNKKK